MLSQKVDRETLHHLASEHTISQEPLEKAFEEAEIYPDKTKWTHFLEKFLLALGLIFLLSGLIFFLAYNWTDLSKVGKLIFVQVLVLMMTAIIITRKELDAVAQIFMTAIVVMIGVCFTVFGQIYQTGADAYDLFLVWTLAAIPFVLISRYPPLWLLFLILINATTHLWGEQILSHNIQNVVFLILFVVNIIATVIWEYCTQTKKWTYTSRWFPRSTFLAATIHITILIWLAMLKHSTVEQPYASIAFLLGTVFFPIVIYFYLRRIKDLMFVAGVIIALMVLLSTFIIRFISSDLGGFFLAGITCVGLTIFMVKLLIETNKKWQKELHHNTNDTL